MKRLVLTAPDDCKVFTPAPLAMAMAKLLPNRSGDRWLEPCVGEGAFLHALMAAGVRRDQITAVELDRHAGPADLCGRYLPGTDFLAWALRTNDRFDRIVGNPPYLPIHRLPPPVRSAALRVQRPDGTAMPPKANCWYAFILAAFRLLRPGGGLCLVLPSGWEYADYAADVRECVPRQFARVEVYRSESSFFPGVLDGCVVLIADGFGQPPSSTRYRSFQKPDQLLGYLGADRETPPPPAVAPDCFPTERFVPFGEIARVRIGAVTGDTDYFLLTESQRRDRRIPFAAVSPVLTRARHLTRSSIDLSVWKQLRDAGERVWLFRPHAAAGRQSKAVKDYLHHAKLRNIPERGKVSGRKPWFRTILPPSPDGFLSGMTPFGPWVCLRRMPGLSATNTLYTVHFKGRLTRAEQASWCLALMSTATARQHNKVGRKYSDGLLKFEPRDVMKLLVPWPPTAAKAAVRIYHQAVGLLLKGECASARGMADAFVANAISAQMSQ